ncbi:hypothetical protein BV394_03400 [Brevirhabdus pacifica]|uniref:Uncharacterized protein n=1 Tax=Brevirhabdus pacifica TaxID=1267768 RepID=A0A1U7DFZ1_9RHOB|nr:hypothetical protein BV394_03400 [Brevirhabdus pacifica]OWU80124.1 hypothetical protein ATO5_04085 [Loktanella sp. 22II-4b]
MAEDNSTAPDSAIIVPPWRMASDTQNHSIARNPTSPPSHRILSRSLWESFSSHHQTPVRRRSLPGPVPTRKMPPPRCHRSANRSA